MSEYQYYEFQAVDWPLTEEEQRAVSRLSSRVETHPPRAIFVYNWGDFSANPREVLVKYYDAMFYVANWGTIRLMFRFPKELIDIRQLEPYWLTPTLLRFVEAFRLDEALVKVAADASPRQQKRSPVNLRERIAALSREGCDEWLLRLAQGKEPHLSLAFQCLLEPERDGESVTQKRRTVQEIRTTHSTRKTLLQRIDKAGLP